MPKAAIDREYMAQEKKSQKTAEGSESKSLALKSWISDVDELRKENRAAEQLSQDDYSVRINA